MKAILVVDIPDDYEEYGDWYIVGDNLRIVYEEDNSLMTYKAFENDLIKLKHMPEKMTYSKHRIDALSRQEAIKYAVEKLGE